MALIGIAASNGRVGEAYLAHTRSFILASHFVIHIMPTYTSPVTVSEFQLYNTDLSADPTLLGFFQSLLETATERVYNYLDLDFTAGTLNVQTFVGSGGDFVLLHQPAEAITAWETVDRIGTLTPQNETALHLFDGGRVVVNADGIFDQSLEHRISYTLPASLTCPETVKQVITEVASIMLRESKQGAGSLGELREFFSDTAGAHRSVFSELTERHRMMLSPYKRYAV